MESIFYDRSGSKTLGRKMLEAGPIGFIPVKDRAELINVPRCERMLHLMPKDLRLSEVLEELDAEKETF